MSLIECKDCGNQISASAKNCPKCGAPVPITVGPDQDQCPWCKTVVHKDALVCPSCRAMKGYATNAHGVMGRKSMIAFGIVVPSIIALVLFIVWWPLGLVAAAFVAFCAWRLKRGPYWYHSRSPT